MTSNSVTQNFQTGKVKDQLPLTLVTILKLGEHLLIMVCYCMVILLYSI